MAVMVKKEEIEEISDLVGKKLIKYYVLWSLAKFALGLLWLGVAFIIAVVGVNYALSNIPMPRV